MELDEDDERFLQTLLVWRRVHPETFRRSLRWTKKRFYRTAQKLEELDLVARTGTRGEGAGCFLQLVGDGQPAQDRDRAIALREIRNIEGRARREGRGLTDEELLTGLDWHARAGGPLSAGRGRPPKPHVDEP